MSDRYESEMHEAASAGNWDKAIAAAKRMPKDENPWDILASEYTIPPSHFNKFLRSIPPSKRSSALFELSFNLHPDLQHEHLDFLGSIDQSDHVKRSIEQHPNWNPYKSKKIAGELAASEFWRSYEKKVDPHHFAAVKAMFSGKPETIKDHRNGTKAYSHGEHYVGYGGLLLSNVTEKPKEGHYRIHDEVIPHLKNHANKVQNAILMDETITKKIIDGKPHILLHRGVGGAYAEKIKNAVSTGKQKLNIKKAPFSSWSTDKEIARSFAVNRHDIGKNNQSSHTAIISAWIPVDKILHSGYHQIHMGQKHGHPIEKEIIVGHPEGQMTIHAKNIEFGHIK